MSLQALCMSASGGMTVSFPADHAQGRRLLRNLGFAMSTRKTVRRSWLGTRARCHVSYHLSSLKGSYIGYYMSYIGLIEGDTGSLDYSSCSDSYPRNLQLPIVRFRKPPSGQIVLSSIIPHFSLKPLAMHFSSLEFTQQLSCGVIS